MSVHNNLFITKLDVKEYAQFNDVAEPVASSNEKGTIFKLTGDNGLWWKPYSENKVNLVNVFGTQFQSEEENIVSSTTISNSWTTRQIMTTPTLPSGTYRIEFTMLYSANNTNTAVRTRLLVNTTTLFNGEDFSMKVVNNTGNRRQHYNASDFYTGSGVFNIELQFRRDGGEGTTPTEISVHYSRIDIWRVS